MKSKGLFCRLSILAVIGLAWFISRAANERGTNDVDSFRLYLTKPPCFSRLIYTDQTVCDDNAFQNRKFIVAYGGSGFYIRHFTAQDNLNAPISVTNKMHGSMLVGRENNLRWQINGFGVGKSISQETNQPDAYAAFADSMRTIIDGLVNFGPQDIVPGSFVWHGNDFEATPSALLQQMRPDAMLLTGAIIVKNGQVIQMDLNLHGHLWSRFNYQYEHSTGRPSWFPAKIIRAGSDKCNYIQVQNVTFGDEDEVMTEFSPEAHILPEVEVVTLVSNNLKISQVNGTNSKVLSLVKIQNADRVKVTSRVVLSWSAIMVRSVLALGLIVVVGYFVSKAGRK